MQAKTTSLAFLDIDRTSPVPIYRQIENMIRQAVMAGELRPGYRLPSTRQLASDLGVSRLTTKNVYEQLGEEGYLDSVRGAGTFVAELLPTDLPAGSATPLELDIPPDRSASNRCLAIASTKATSRLDGTAAFRPGVPALDLFPKRAWAGLLSKATRSCPPEYLGYGPMGGIPELKDAVAELIHDLRGVQCQADQIIVTAGAQQAFALLNPGDVVWCEDPGHIAGRDAMRILGANVVPVPVDDEGIDIDYARANCPPAKLIFMTPSHQHPTGVTMSLKRRLAALEYARQNDCWIIEDDYDNEYRYSGRPLPSLQGMDRHSRVIYVGTFSKTLFPAIRVGYLVAPDDHVDAFAASQILMSQNVSAVIQMALARFIADGSYIAHTRRMRNAYKARQDCLVEAVNSRAKGLISCQPTDAGMHLLARLDGLEDQTAAEYAWRSDIDCLPICIYSDVRKLPDVLLLGFACVREEDIPTKAETLVKALEQGLRDSLFLH